jgi:hypothetical protein
MSSNLFYIYGCWETKSKDLKTDFSRVNGNMVEQLMTSDYPLAVEWRCLRTDMAILSRAMYKIQWETIVRYRHLEWGKNER